MEEPKDELLDPKKAMQHIMETFPELLEMECRAEGDRLVLPEWNAVLIPQIQQLSERIAVLNLYLDAPQWGKTLYECSAGMGNDVKTSIGMAVSSFLFSFMQGIGMMEADTNPISFSTRFADREHRWKLYLSNIVCIGKNKGNTEIGMDFYWEALQEEIVKRLGNQKLCYVKIYGSRMGDQITGECRIDDIKSEELSKKVEEIVGKWDVDGFASQKQFFFIRQEEETLIPNPYEGREGFQLLKDRVARAARMFHESRTEEEYCSLTDRLSEAFQDVTLGNECFSFLPELCAENAFPESGFSETVEFQWPDGRIETVYKSQLADYYVLWNALSIAFADGSFGEAAEDIYREYIGSSAIFSCFEQMKESGGNLEDARSVTLLFQVDKDFEIR